MLIFPLNTWMYSGEAFVSPRKRRPSRLRVEWPDARRGATRFSAANFILSPLERPGKVQRVAVEPQRPVPVLSQYHC